MIERLIGSEEMLRMEDEDVLLCFGRGEPGNGGDFPARLQALLDVCDEVRAIRFGRQVHGNLIASLSEDASRPFSGAAEVGMCDGLITDEPGLGLALQTADCVPVLLAERRGRAVAAAHAGWRGLVAGILEATVACFGHHGITPDELVVAVVLGGVLRVRRNVDHGSLPYGVDLPANHHAPRSLEDEECLLLVLMAVRVVHAPRGVCLHNDAYPLRFGYRRVASLHA